MKTTLTDRGQTAVPARIRKRFGMKPGQKLVWVEDGNVIYILPATKDPVQTFRGSSKKNHLNAALLRSRQEDARHI